MASAATSALIRNSRFGLSLRTSTFAGDEGAYIVQAAGIQHVTRLNPATARGSDPEAHLPRQPFGAVAVAVDRDGYARRDSPPCDRTVHVEVSWRAIDLHRGTGRGGRFEHCVEVDIESRRPRGRTICRMGDDVHERMVNSFQIALGQLWPFLLASVMQRRQDDVKAGENVIVEVQGAVTHDIDLDAVENGEGRILPAKRFDFIALSRNLVERQLAAGPRALRMVRDRHVFVAELFTREHHRFGAVAAV